MSKLGEIMSRLAEEESEIKLPFVPYEPASSEGGSADSSSRSETSSKSADGSSSSRTYTIDGETYTPDENETPILRMPD